VYLDFLALTGTGDALRALRKRERAYVGVAPPRIRKPGEEKIDRYLAELRPDALLVRSVGGLRDGACPTSSGAVPLRIGDHSLNVTNRRAAALVLAHGLSVFTPAFDLDEQQLVALLTSPFAPFAEVVVHHPMPLFHMEHCVFAALLSDGHDERTCGRPCERHGVSLRDRTGIDHPVEADVGCRNTVFHAVSQSALNLVPELGARGVRRFRIELLREDASLTTHVVRTVHDVIEGRVSAPEAYRALRLTPGYGVVRGSLRVLANA
jgi:putative protease